MGEQHSYLSTADEDWKKGRCFKDYTWGCAIDVPATTLNELIETHGMPDFCKIDVEGYELNVLKGMTKPIPYLSFEFAYEFLDQKTKPCLDYLNSFGLQLFQCGYARNRRVHCKGELDEFRKRTFLSKEPSQSSMLGRYLCTNLMK